jgi:hypothetical protein
MKHLLVVLLLAFSASALGAPPARPSFLNAYFERVGEAGGWSDTWVRGHAVEYLRLTRRFKAEELARIDRGENLSVQREFLAARLLDRNREFKTRMHVNSYFLPELAREAGRAFEEAASPGLPTIVELPTQAKLRLAAEELADEWGVDRNLYGKTVILRAGRLVLRGPGDRGQYSAQLNEATRLLLREQFRELNGKSLRLGENADVSIVPYNARTRNIALREIGLDGFGWNRSRYGWRELIRTPTHDDNPSTSMRETLTRMLREYGFRGNRNGQVFSVRAIVNEPGFGPRRHTMWVFINPKTLELVSVYAMQAERDAANKTR